MQPLVLGVSGGGLAEVGPRQSLCRLTRPQSALRGVGDNRGTDWLLVGFALVRVLLLSAKHLFLAAKQWQFAPASG